MELNFKSYFKNAAINCEYCSEANKNKSNGKDASSQAESNKYLNQIIEFSDKNSEDSNLALILLSLCNECDFKEPKRKNNLDISGIHV